MRKVHDVRRKEISHYECRAHKESILLSATADGICLICNNKLYPVYVKDLPTSQKGGK